MAEQEIRIRSSLFDEAGELMNTFSPSILKTSLYAGNQIFEEYKELKSENRNVEAEELIKDLHALALAVQLLQSKILRGH